MSWFRKLFAPDVEELAERCDELESELERIDADVSDLYDRILPMLDRISNRAAVRENRAKSKDSSTENDIRERPGIIPTPSWAYSSVQSKK